MYTPDKSYPGEGNFVRVWNSGTPEFQAVQPVFERLAFSQVVNHCSSLRASARGNRQDALGFSSQNLAERCPLTSVSIPGMNQGTLDFQNEFVKMGRSECGSFRTPHTERPIFFEGAFRVNRSE